jgi:hypothetical protein
VTNLDQLIDDAIYQTLGADARLNVTCLDSEYSRLEHGVRFPDPNYATGQKVGVEVDDVNPVMSSKIYDNQILKILVRQLLGKEPEPKSYARWRAMADCDISKHGVTLEQAYTICAIAKHRRDTPGKPYDKKAIKRRSKTPTHRKTIYGLLEALSLNTVVGRDLPIVLAHHGLVRDFADLRAVLPGFSVNRYYSINAVLGLVMAGDV